MHIISDANYHNEKHGASTKRQHPYGLRKPRLRFSFGISAAALGTLALLGAASLHAADLQSDSARERAFAVRALGEQGGEEAVAPLVNALGDANVFVRAEAMQALHALGGGTLKEAVAVALADALAHANPRARAGAAETLGLLKEQASASTLTRLLKDEDPPTQHAAACALARMRSVEAVPGLIALAADDNAAAFARMGAAWALGELEAREAVAPLLAVIEGGRRGEWNYTSVTVYAVEALGKINDPESLPRLVEAMAIGDRHLRSQLALTLRQMTGENFGEDQEKWKAYLTSDS